MRRLRVSNAARQAKLRARAARVEQGEVTIIGEHAIGETPVCRSESILRRSEFIPPFLSVGLKPALQGQGS